MGSQRKTVIAVLIGAAALAAPLLASAQQQDRGWYIGGGLGQAKHKGVTCVAGGSCDDKDTAWKLLGGYQVNRTFAAEFGYTDLGKVRTSGGGVTAEATSTAWELVGLAGIPVANRFSAFGKLGFYRAETEQTGTVSASETNTGMTYGLGLRFDVSRNLGVRGEWQRYNDVGGGNIVKHDVDVLGIGVTWKF
jgi:OmpA-OmpF porin, OOP family